MVMVNKTKRPILALKQRSKGLCFFDFAIKRYGIDTNTDSPHEGFDAQE